MSDIKEILDCHFSENIKYYNFLAKTLFKGRYIYEDLVQETYLEMINRTNYKSLDKYYLLFIGKKIMNTLYVRRLTLKKYKCGKDSPLSELNTSLQNQSIIDNLFINEVSESFDIDKYNKSVINKITGIIYEGLENDDYKTQVFIMSQIESINSISKRTGISRPNLTKARNQMINIIKEKINI